MDGAGPHFDAWRAVIISHAAVAERLQKALAAGDLPAAPAVHAA
jgi:hypothetical protein